MNKNKMSSIKLEDEFSFHSVLSVLIVVPNSMEIRLIPYDIS